MDSPGVSIRVTPCELLQNTPGYRSSDNKSKRITLDAAPGDLGDVVCDGTTSLHGACTHPEHPLYPLERHEVVGHAMCTSAHTRLVTVGIWCVCDVVTSMDTTRVWRAREANATHPMLPSNSVELVHRSPLDAYETGPT
jgi:hypothetical protein